MGTWTMVNVAMIQVIFVSLALKKRGIVEKACLPYLELSIAAVPFLYGASFLR